MGIGQNTLSNKEGIHYKNFFATYLTGPFLIRNPYFTIYFVKYYTKLILKYGNKEEKMILASYVNILKTLKN